MEYLKPLPIKHSKLLQKEILVFIEYTLTANNLGFTSFHLPGLRMKISTIKYRLIGFVVGINIFGPMGFAKEARNWQIKISQGLFDKENSGEVKKNIILDTTDNFKIEFEHSKTICNLSKQSFGRSLNCGDLKFEMSCENNNQRPSDVSLIITMDSKKGAYTLNVSCN